jgi:hypothetical protein
MSQGKSLVAAMDLTAGHVMIPEDIAVKVMFPFSLFKHPFIHCIHLLVRRFPARLVRMQNISTPSSEKCSHETVGETSQSHKRTSIKKKKKKKVFVVNGKNTDNVHKTPIKVCRKCCRMRAFVCISLAIHSIQLYTIMWP